MSRPVVFTSLTHSLSPLFFRIDSPCPPPASPTASPRCRVSPRSHGLTPPHALPRPRPIDAILRPRVSQRPRPEHEKGGMAPPATSATLLPVEGSRSRHCFSFLSYYRCFFPLPFLYFLVETT